MAKGKRKEQEAREYEELLLKGVSKEKAGREVAEGHEQPPKTNLDEGYEQLTEDELYERAKQLHIEDYTDMNRYELIEAIRRR
ncbi:MAG: Rho termination factor N-terminal domain-containing protein [Chitinispirillaceae bacterium]